MPVVYISDISNGEHKCEKSIIKKFLSEGSVQDNYHHKKQHRDLTIKKQLNIQK